MDKIKHTLDAPNSEVDKKMEALGKRLGITEEDIKKYNEERDKETDE